MTVNTNIGKITASKETLNIISIIFQEASESYANRGRAALSKEAQKASDEIFKIMEMTGFYKFD